ncbi:MAG: LytR/AlgR family response regulator transcription factor [Flammeovirgaceae bacterium]
MKVLIVEDEELTADHFCQLLQRCDASIEVLQHANSVKNAVGWLKGNPTPDLIFLDIELGDGTGFDVLEESQTVAPIVFTTAYNEFAIRAFRYNSLHYLLKPIDFQDLKEALTKIGPQLHTAAQPDFTEIKNLLSTSYKKRFMVKIGDQYQHVVIQDIAYFRFEKGFAILCTHNNRELPIDYSLDQLAEMLNPLDFFRLNRKYIVSIASIRQVHTYFNSRLLVKLCPEVMEEVIVSRDRVANFKKWLDV